MPVECLAGATGRFGYAGVKQYLRIWKKNGLFNVAWTKNTERLDYEQTGSDTGIHISGGLITVQLHAVQR